MRLHSEGVAARGGTIIASEVPFYEIDRNGKPVYRDDGSLNAGRTDALTKEGRNLFVDEVKNGRFSQMSDNQKGLLPATAQGRIVFYGGNAQAAGIAGMSLSEVISSTRSQWGGFRLFGYGGSQAGTRLTNWIRGMYGRE